jgi:hypothetical protein
MRQIDPVTNTNHTTTMTTTTSNTTRDKLLAKVQALLAMADTSRGSTPAEAEAFMRKAQELMARHGLEEMDIAALGDVSSPAFDIGTTNHDADHTRRNADLYVGTVLKQAFGVKVVFSTYRTPGSNQNKLRIIIMGDSTDREIARVAAPMLYRTMVNGYNQWLKETFGTCRAGSVGTERSFCQGVVDGYLQASEEGKQLVLKQLSKEQQAQFGLILANKEALITAYVQKAFPRLGSIRTQSKAGSHEAKQRGFATGAGMNLMPTQKIA